MSHEETEISAAVGEPGSRPARLAVIGGGVGGMTAAWQALRTTRELGLDLELRVFEQRTRVGGSIVTEVVDGCIVEGGPDCFVSEKPWGLELVRELGLGETLSATNEERRKTYILWKERMHPLPDGLILLVPTRIMPFVTATLFSWPGKLRMALDLVLPRRTDGVDESLGDFIRRRLGREALDKLGEPLVAGIHSGDPETMSVRATFPRFVDMEREDRSLIVAMLKRMKAARAARAARQRAAASPTGKPARVATADGPGVGVARPGAGKITMFMTLDGGLGQLVDRLVEDVGESALVTEARVTELTPAPEGGWTVHLEDGGSWASDAVIVSTPAFAAADMLGAHVPALADELRGIPYVTSATVTLAYDAATFPKDPDGFGVVVPKAHARKIKAFTWVTSKFFRRAPAGTVLMRCFVRPQDETGRERDEAALIRAATEELSSILKIEAAPLWARAFRWDQAMPQYVVGHLARVDRIEAALAGLPGLALAGGAYRGSGIPDTVRHSREQARRVVGYLAGRED